MKRLSILLLVLLCIGIQPSCAIAKELDVNDYKSIHYCYLLKKRYAFAVSHNIYESMTAWNIESKGPPPVSPQQAFKVAKERLSRIEIPKGYFWTFDQAALQPVNGFFQDGKWIWKVSFRFTRDGFSSGPPTMMDFLVSMDGTLIEPIIDDWKQ